MKHLFVFLSLTLACLFAIYIVSCGTRETDEDTSVALVSTEPATVPTSIPVATKPVPEPEPEIIPEPEPIIPEGMVLIPEGEFQMGSNDGNADNDEQPVHTVHLDAFYIDANEVTNGEFKDFVLANPAWQKDLIDDRFQDGNYLHDWNGNNYPLGQSDHPVRYVSWYAAMAYAVWVDKRLPTEAEWEKASRGGLKRKQYPWGNGINFNRANYGKNIGETTPWRVSSQRLRCI